MQNSDLKNLHITVLAAGPDAERAVSVQSATAIAEALTDDPEKILMKLVVAPSEGNRVVGVHLLGADSPEIIQATAIAVTMGATKEDFSATMALHPSSGEELVLMRKKV